MDIENLRSVSLFRDLNSMELGALAKLFRVRPAGVGERLIEEGSPVSTFFVVCSGVVHVRRLAQKRETLLCRLGVGAFFGEINMFDPGVATSSVYAVKATTLAEVSHEEFRAFMQRHPETGYKIVTVLMAEMCRRLRQTNSRLINSLYWSSAEATV